MVNVGFVGLGKLGLPVALGMESRGHTVVGYDVNPAVAGYIEDRALPYVEKGAQELLETTSLKVLQSVVDVVAVSDIVFVPIQTPHDPRFEGITPLPEERKDFDYEHLKSGVRAIAHAAENLKKTTTVVVISTVLPGTMDREIRPLLNSYTRLCYNPYFIAMGTTIQDFLEPEFVLLGTDDPAAKTALEMFYATIHDKPVFSTTIETAELTKVAYNTFIGMKIVFANTMMEICQKTGANVDDLSSALALADDRLISPRYMRGGMGDAGGCHPRDNIALSWLARELELSYDIFDSLMKCREEQTKWLAEVAREAADQADLPLIVLGKAYKADINLTVGSCSLLMMNYLPTDTLIYDPYVDGDGFPPVYPAVFFIGTNHECYKDWHFPEGSVVIDPWGYIEDQAGVDVWRIGR